MKDTSNSIKTIRQFIAHPSHKYISVWIVCDS